VPQGRAGSAAKCCQIKAIGATCELGVEESRDLWIDTSGMGGLIFRWLHVVAAVGRRCAEVRLSGREVIPRRLRSQWRLTVAELRLDMFNWPGFVGGDHSDLATIGRADKRM
jgi:hypothetical protein